MRESNLEKANEEDVVLAISRGEREREREREGNQMCLEQGIERPPSVLILL